ncbi:MAG: hypothetical protein AAF569_00010 [Pseudomonadota bacterium]
MFTSIDKAIIAILGAIVFLVSEYTDLEPDFISQDIIQSAAAIVTAALVYLVPNKE